MRLIDAEELIENLLYDVALDEKILDDMDFVGNSRELIQFDKDCKQNAIEFLRDAPTIEIESNCSESSNNWTPCSERPPEEDGRYLVTLENGHEKILNYATAQTIRYPQGFYYTTEDGFAWRQTQNLVTAWMPLPEPWKGEAK